MTLVIIPARMGSTRLPGKPLLKIGDETIIERCIHQAKAAGFRPYVATDSNEIVQECKAVGAEPILTGDCASGTDRVAAAAEIIDPEGKHEFVINYQGDMPFLDPKDLKWFVNFVETCPEQGPFTAFTDQNQVVIDDGFFRDIPFLHIGLYGFRRNDLKVFSMLPPSEEEKKHSLEQLRIPFKQWEFFQFDSMPIEINTQADLDRARSCLT